MKLYIKADIDLDTKIQEFNAVSNVGTIDEILAELNNSAVEYKLIDIDKNGRLNNSYYTATFQINKLKARDFSFEEKVDYVWSYISSITYDRYGYTIDELHISTKTFVHSNDMRIAWHVKEPADKIKEAISKLKSVNRYKFILNNIKAEVEKLPGITLDVESTNLDYSKIPSATCGLYINGNLYVDGKGHSIINIADDVFIDDINPLVSKVKRYINKYNKQPSNNRIVMSEYAKLAPKNIQRAANKFVHWISNEKCGNANNLEDAYNNVYKRTIDNKRCGYFNSTQSAEQLKNLFDYANQNNFSVLDLIRFCRYA